MNNRSIWRKIIHPGLSAGLIIIIIFLFISAAGNVFRIYDAVCANNNSDVLLYGAAAILYILPAIGLLRLKKWARILEIVYSGLMVILGIITFLTYSFAQGAFIIATHGLIAGYLLSGKCRKLFI